MAQLPRNNGREEPHRESGDAELSNAARSHILRTARALIGTKARSTERATPGRPVRSADDVAQALKAVTKWYRDNLGSECSAGEAVARGATNLDEAARQYLAVRAEWENREAVSLAQQMRDGAGVTRTAAGSQAEVPAAQETSATRHRALLVDDSSDILITVGSFLEALGFDVVTAASADMALEILGQGPTVDLLVSDHAMPGMTGRDLAMQARQTHRNLRALIITGYSDAEELSDLPQGVELLAKPFRRAELSTRVRALLETGDGAAIRGVPRANGRI